MSLMLFIFPLLPLPVAVGKIVEYHPFAVGPDDNPQALDGFTASVAHPVLFGNGYLFHFTPPNKVAKELQWSPRNPSRIACGTPYPPKSAGASSADGIAKSPTIGASLVQCIAPYLSFFSASSHLLVVTLKSYNEAVLGRRHTIDFGVNDGGFEAPGHQVFGVHHNGHHGLFALRNFGHRPDANEHEIQQPCNE